VNDNKRRAKEMVKYLKVMKHYRVDYDQYEFIYNKYYREEMMKNVDTNNNVTTKITKEKKLDDDKLDYELVSESDGEGNFDEEEIQEEIEAELYVEDKNDDEEIDDEDDNDPNGNVINKSIITLDKEIPSVINDNELNITKKPENDIQAKYERMLKYLLIIQYYKLSINITKFVNDESFLEEKIKEKSFKEHLKKFDEEENVEIEEYNFIGKELQIKYKGE
jgi:hypothetical protein